MVSLRVFASAQSSLTNSAFAGLITAVIIFALCVLGIFTRAAFGLASLWPANAGLLAIMAVHPRTNTPLTWVLVAGSYLAADLLTGSDFASAAILNGANLVGVAAGLGCVRLWAKQFFPMSKPSGVVRLFLVIACASTVTGLAGALIAGPVFGMTVLDGFFLWTASEFVNYSIFLPLLLGQHAIKPRQTSPLVVDNAGNAEKYAALAALIVSCALMPVVGGAGSLMLHVPAFIWCSTQFTPRTSIILAGLTAMWILYAVPIGLISLDVHHVSLTSHWDIASFRLGIGFLTLGALAIAMLNTFWLNANDELEHRANHDFLTGLLNRRQFNAVGEFEIARQRAGTPNVAMAIDIDRFKTINDTHGHPLGDQVLQVVAGLLADGLRKGDILGRIGGEEFAVILPGAGLEEGKRVAERLREAIAHETVKHGDISVVTSVSIGVVEFVAPANLPRMLSLADEALYEAKNAGRNRVVVHKSATLLKSNPA